MSSKGNSKTNSGRKVGAGHQPKSTGPVAPPPKGGSSVKK